MTPSAGSAPASIRGALSDEPLHLEALPGRAGVFYTVGAVPLGAPDSVLVQLLLRDSAGVVEGSGAWLRVGRRTVRRERITTPPEFARPPGPALAARIAAERARIREVMRRTHEMPRLWREAFVRPRQSRVTSPFGTRRIVNGAAAGRHWGVDLDGTPGAPVRATNRGVVALAGDFYYGGRSVYLDHGAGLVTGYLHLRDILVAQGDTVRPGQLIGRVGATGRVTGPHLHWLAQYGRVAVDPLALLDLEPPRAADDGVPADAPTRSPR